MADLTRIITHTTALLNAATRDTAATPIYGTAVGDKARTAAEIAETCLLAAIETATAICEADSNPWRPSFLIDTALTHGTVIPFHFGDVTPPSIVPFSGSSIILCGTRRHYDEIASYRINRNGAYGPVHNTVYQGGASPLAGYYDVVNGIFYFTGYTASMMLAIFTRADVLTKLPDAAEPTIIKVALGKSAKDGDASDGIFMAWKQEGQADLAAIRGGATAFPALDEQVAARQGRLA